MLLVGLGLIISASVQAASNITPESGWWSDPDTPGRGYAIEIQDNVAFIAAFTYDPLETDGVRRPIWFTAPGVLIGDNIFEGEFVLVENGTCIGCNYTKNSTHPTEKHSVQIEFHSDITGTMTIDGDSFPIERFKFAPSYENPNTRLLGQWHIVATSPSSFPFYFTTPVSGEVLVFDRITEINGVTYIEGCSVGRVTRAYCSSGDELVKGRYHPNINEFHVLVDKGNNERFYAFVPFNNRIVGIVDQYSTTNGDFNSTRAQTAYGNRSSSRAFVQTGVGPAKATSRAQKAEADTSDRQETREQMIRKLNKIAGVKFVPVE